MHRMFKPWRYVLGLLPLGLIVGSADPITAAPGADPSVMAGHCSSAVGKLPARTPKALGSKLEILSWNIQKAGNPGWDRDLADFSAGVDLAFLQEASLQAEIESTVTSPLFASFARGYTTELLETGVMTLSSHLPTLRCQLSINEPWLGTPKATSVTEYPLENRDDRLLAINLHAVNFTFGTEEFGTQFRVLGDILERHDGPVILAGDLNTWSERREALVAGFLENHGLLPVEFSDDRRTRAFGRALDHVYVRGMQASSAEVIPVTSSDHNPLRVSLRIQ